MSIAERIAAVPESSWGLALRVVVLSAAGLVGFQGYAQAPANAPATPAAPATFSGCVQKAPGSSTTLVISTATTCATLTGKVSVDVLAGHQVDLTGVLTPRTATDAASIEVHVVNGVGKSCSDVCALHPPHGRGLHPGGEGGTPGAAAPPQP
jgi:hypothetical protein